MSFEHSPLSIIILISTAIVSFLAFSPRSSLIDKYSLSPYLLVTQNKWYLIITSGFLHADFVHLLFNMLTFYFFAPILEQTIGTFDFLLLYFGSMILGSITTLIKYKKDPHYRSLGASGGVSGIIFAFILYYPNFNIYLYFAIGIPAPLFAVLYLVYCYLAARYSKDNINHEAHFWGAAVGMILAIIMNPKVIFEFLNKIF